MIRHQLNQNLALHYEPHYEGIPIQADKGPFIIQYLYRLLATINLAITQYREVFAFRVDLRLPAHYTSNEHAGQNEVIERFMESLKAKIKHNRKMALRANSYAHNSTVRYVWTRETGQRGKPHYHLAILLNKDAFCALGTYEIGKDNMFNRLNQAWASALGLTVQDVVGLVQIPDNACYTIHRNDPASISKFFFRASYLCKAATKTYGSGAHGFGASRS